MVTEISIFTLIFETVFTILQSPQVAEISQIASKLKKMFAYGKMLSCARCKYI